MKKSWRFPLIDLLGVVLTCGLLGSRESLLGDPGVGWHLRAGELIWREGKIPAFDPFLLWPGQPPVWIHDQWLSDVFLWIFYQQGGIPGLHAIVAVVSVSTFVLVLAPLLRRVEASALVAFLFLLLAGVIASVQWFLRPVIFSLFLFACTYRFSISKLASPAPVLLSLILFTPIFALWANVHGGFWLGLGLFAALLLELVLRKKISMTQGMGVGALALLLTALNPWGFSLWRSTIGLASDSYFTHLNQEWLRPDFADPAFWPFFIALLLLGLGCLGKNRAAISRFDLLLIIPLLALSLLHRRYLPFFAVLLPLPLVKLLPGHLFFKFQTQERHLPVCSLILWTLLLGPAFTLKRIPFFEAHTSAFPAAFPTAELEKILQDPGPIFHSPDIGGYLIWLGSPRLKAYIDDRNQLIGPQRYEEYFMVIRADAGWEEVLRKWNMRWILVSRDIPLMKAIQSSPSWEDVSLTPGSPWALYRFSALAAPS